MLPKGGASLAKVLNGSVVMIRQLKSQADRQMVSDIWLASAPKALAYLPRHQWQQELCWLNEQLLAQSEAWLYDDGRVRGFVLLSRDGLNHLCVDPDAERRGIGRALLSFAQSRRHPLRLSAPCQHKDAIAFFRHQGFKPVSEQLDGRTGQWQLLMIHSTSQGYFQR